MALFAVPYFVMVASGDVVMILLAAMIALVLVAMMSGPTAALIAETFTGRVRYSSAAVGASLGAAVGGGATAVLAVDLFQHFHSALPVAFYMVSAVLASALGMGLLRERSRQDLAVEYDDPRAARGVHAGARS